MQIKKNTFLKQHFFFVRFYGCSSRRRRTIVFARIKEKKNKFTRIFFWPIFNLLPTTTFFFLSCRYFTRRKMFASTFFCMYVCVNFVTTKNAQSGNIICNVLFPSLICRFQQSVARFRASKDLRYVHVWAPRTRKTKTFKISVAIFFFF